MAAKFFDPLPGLTETEHAAIDAADHGSGAASDGQVLTADGSGGAAWEDATGGGSAVFSGAKISDPAGTDQDLGTDTDTAVTFDTELWDTDGYADLGTNNDRLTIPTGLDGIFQLSASVETTQQSNGYVFVTIWKNGLTGERVARDKLDTSDTVQDAMVVTPPPVEAEAGDYFLLSVRVENTGQNLIRSTVVGSPRFSIVRLGAL